MAELVGLAAIGCLAGALGTLIGAGGGFLLVPVLTLLYPRQEPEVISGIALAMVFLNGVSGSIAYARLRRIDYRAALLFSTTAVPGSAWGATIAARVSRGQFEAVAGAVLLIGSGLLLVRRALVRQAARGHGAGLRGAAEARRELAAAGEAPRRLRLALGTVLSFGVGVISSLVGIGGGIIQVPLMVTLLGFPVHTATATSHLMVAISSLTGVTVHVLHGTLAPHAPRIAALALGAIPGAQLGAALSQRLDGAWILRVLAAALAFVGLRMLGVL